MHGKDNKNTCVACSCPCDMHKEHAHGDKHKDEGEKEGVCMACSCPCDEHKEHAHK